MLNKYELWLKASAQANYPRMMFMYIKSPTAKFTITPDATHAQVRARISKYYFHKVINSSG